MMSETSYPRELSSPQLDALLAYRREERYDISPDDVRANTRQSLIRLGYLTLDGQLTDWGRIAAWRVAQGRRPGRRRT